MGGRCAKVKHFEGNRGDFLEEIAPLWGKVLQLTEPGELSVKLLGA